jgi:hypothetical protein
LLFLAGLVCACAPRTEKVEGELAVSAAGALAVLEAGENPLWFELTGEGPRQLGFPGEAGLSPFTPWPLARHIRFMLPRGDDLILGVNRDGFLRFAPWDGPASEKGGGTALYCCADAAYWGQYTLAALFPFEDRAAALLYRDDFFVDPVSPLPSPRTFVLDPDSPEPRPLEIPAFGAFPAAEGWDLDALHAGSGGYWYYRAVRKKPEQPEMGYYRTGDLSLEGEAVSITVFQNSAFPKPAAAAPALLRSVLEAAFALSPGAATVVSPAFPGPRRFSGGPAGSKGDGGADKAEAAEGTKSAADLEIAGFYREPAAGRPGIALLVLPDGRGFFHTEGGPAGEAASAGSPPGGPRPLSLPALPPGFAYTAAALCGNTLIAAWEEQEGYSIGAAGFMAIRRSYLF